jgi:hypothetical protein
MKKLLFVLAFTFIGQQAFSQMYIVVATDNDCITNSGADGYELEIHNPTGSVTEKCLQESYSEINLELNNIISQGYKLLHIQDVSSNFNYTSLTSASNPTLNEAIKRESWPFYTKYYLAIP